MKGFIRIVFLLLLTSNSIAADFFHDGSFILSDESLKKVSIKHGEPSTVILEGRLRDGWGITIDEKPIELKKDGSFIFELKLSLEPKPIPILLIKKSQKSTARLYYEWKKEIQTMRFKVRVGKEVVQKEEGVGVFPSDEWLSFTWKDKDAYRSWKQDIWWAHAYLNAFAVLPNTGGFSVAPQFSWVPTFTLSESLAFRIGIGATAIRYNSSRVFAVTEISPLGSYKWEHVRFEAGPSIQIWHNDGQKHLGIQALLSYQPEKNFLGVINRFFTGYTLSREAHSSYHMLKLGIGW